MQTYTEIRRETHLLRRALREELDTAEFNYGVACSISSKHSYRKPYADDVERIERLLRELPTDRQLSQRYVTGQYD